MPTVVVASRDEADPGHPLAVGERYAQAIPRAALVVEEAAEPVRSPIAWQGGQLSRVLAELLAAHGVDELPAGGGSPSATIPGCA